MILLFYGTKLFSSSSSQIFYYFMIMLIVTQLNKILQKKIVCTIKSSFRNLHGEKFFVFFFRLNLLQRSLFWAVIFFFF